jgi:hypothetical protein
MQGAVPLGHLGHPGASQVSHGTVAKETVAGGQTDDKQGALKNGENPLAIEVSDTLTDGSGNIAERANVPDPDGCHLDDEEQV